ncbi:PAS domain S-box protein [Sphingobacterium faecium]|uniref:PAS domain S-box protein n=1 Tax=Sphingobacterium faecium TaxID=34087 RepID=UPI002468F33C|nr:PAS domain S-box protein [Sphingobacterium faecium]MDH5826820.1 PAS domain S-box protein [Sphingobacterium faecium]
MDVHEKLTELEKENSQLRKRVAELSDFIENGSVPLHWVNNEGIIIWANQAELDLVGYTADEYIGHPISNFHKDAEVIQEILMRLSNNETLRDFPARLKCKDGSIKYVTISSNALFENDQFIHSRCFTKDVTQLIKEEQRKNKLLHLLEESVERLRLAIEATDLGTWDWDFEEGKIYFSDKTKEILDYKFNGVIDRTIFQLIHPDDRNSINLKIEQLSRSTSNGHFDFMCRILKPDLKNIAWIRVQGATYFNYKQEPSRIIGSILDITDIKKSETKNAELVAIVNSSHDAIVGKTLDGIVTSWNSAAEELFGFTAREMIGQHIEKILPDDRKDEEEEILDKIKTGESLQYFETKRRTKSDKILDVLLSSSPIRNEEGNIFGISQITRDISDKKQEERRKNDFISMVSHELKTPLTSILLFTQILQKKYDETHDETSKQINDKIETQAKKMVSMIRDFLSLARIEEGKLQLNKEPLSLLEIFEEVKSEAELLISKHTIKIACTVAVTIFADRDKILQVFTNLVSNAIKYSPAGGTISLGCEKLENAIRIYVKDQGIGIEPDNQKKLFDRFYRVDNEEMTHISGFGIGLYIVSEILRYHNSKIEVDSQKGVGTTFHFVLEEANMASQ